MDLPRFPAQFEQNMRALLGDEGFEAYAATFSRPYRQGLRVNPLKLTNDEFLEHLKLRDDLPEEALSPVPWCPTGFLFEGETSLFSKHPDYQAGLYYLQEPSAMAPAAILPICEGDVVLDLCAAPGGKSTQLAGKLGRSGVLFSNDISASRAKALLKNLELAGSTQSVVLSETPYQLAQRFPAYFDKILVDAPCSGEGMFQKDSSIMNNWAQYGNEYYAKLQWEILGHAYRMLRPGGMLLYSTCTFSPMEDEQMIDRFLAEHEDMSLEDIPKTGGMEDGHPEWTDSGRSELAKTARFWPQKLEGQGHFAALLFKSAHAFAASGASSGASPTAGAGKGFSASQSKSAGSNVGAFSKADLELFSAWAEENLTRDFRDILPQGGMLQKFSSQLFWSPVAQEELRGLRVLRSGLLLGELKKDRFEPAQAWAMALKQGDVKREAVFAPGDYELTRYLRGESPSGDFEDGWTLVMEGRRSDVGACAEGTREGAGAYPGIAYPLGWAKAVKGTLKNKYLRGWIQA